MSRASLLARGHVAAEAGMADTCVIRRRTGAATDPGTGASVPVYLSPDPYVGKCRVQQHRAGADRQDVGQDFLLMLQLEVQLPITATGLQVGDEITITAASNDADLMGRTFKIHDLAHKSEATARRVQCTEKTGS